jgi:hypothetical protein
MPWGSCASAIAASQPLRALLGGLIEKGFSPEMAIISDGAGQTIGVVPDFVNINASNGVIHVIDTVMLPFAP